MYEHNFFANHKDAKYPTICSKCGLGIDKYTTPTPNDDKNLPPCMYPTVPPVVNHYITNSYETPKEKAYVSNEVPKT